jgi:VWFA-related protein
MSSAAERRVITTALLFALANVHTPAQRPPTQGTTFLARTDLVLLDASVLDRDRRPVRGLTAVDFTVLDGGVEQPIVSFVAVDVPIWPESTAAWTREVGPDVASNRLDARRAVVIVMDDYSARREPDVMRTARSIGDAVIGQLGPADLAAVVYVVGRKNGQEFTLDRSRLRAAVDRFIPTGIVQAQPSRFSASTPTTGLQSMSSIPIPDGVCIRDCVAAALRNAAEVLGAWPSARKTIVLVSPGRQSAAIDDAFDQNDERSALFASLGRANVSVYQFDPHGLQAGPQPSTDFGTFAENTGGRAFTNTNDPQDMIPQMLHENSSYYLLGIRPSSGSIDGRFHRLTVRVNRPETQVRTRAGYYAIGDRPNRDRSAKQTVSAVDRALSGGLPTGDVPLSLTVSPFATTGKPGTALAIAARLDVDAPLPAAGVVELTAVAFRDDWKQIADVTQRFDLSATQPLLPSREMTVRLDVPPGRYEIRGAVRSLSDDRAGSVYASVIVPDFSRETLSLSGVVVDRQSSGAAVPDVLSSVVPVRMTTQRVFAPEDHVAAFARVYQRRSRPPAAVRVTSRVVDTQNQTAWTTDTTLESSAFDAERQVDYRLELPLDRLVAGDYLLTIEATAAASTARRDVRFSVRR